MITPFSGWQDAKIYPSGRKDQNVVVDSDGDVIATVPKRWTEDDVKQALAIAHEAYILGFESGELNIKNQFKQLMQI